MVTSHPNVPFLKLNFAFLNASPVFTKFDFVLWLSIYSVSLALEEQYGVRTTSTVPKDTGPPFYLGLTPADTQEID